MVRDIMKYELIPKDVLDEALSQINEVRKSLTEANPEAKLWLDRAYTTIRLNRTGCNVQPGDE